MALKAGRVGVYPQDLDSTGHIRNQDSPDPYILPVASENVLGGVKPVAKTSDMTQDIGVDSEGKLYVEPPTAGLELYYKDFQMTRNESTNNIYTGNIIQAGYTPISCAIISRYGGYAAYGSIFHSSSEHICVLGYAYEHAQATVDFIARVYYMKGTPTELI